MKLTNGIHISASHTEVHAKLASNANSAIKSSASKSSASTTPKINIPRRASRQGGLHPLQKSLVSQVKALEERKAALSPNQEGGRHTVVFHTALEAIAAVGAGSVGAFVTKHPFFNSSPRGRVLNPIAGALLSSISAVKIKNGLQTIPHPAWLDADKVPKTKHTDPINGTASFVFNTLAMRSKTLSSLPAMTFRGFMANTGVSAATGAAGGAANAALWEQNRATQTFEPNARLTPDTHTPPTEKQLIAGAFKSQIPALSLQKVGAALSAGGIAVPDRLKHATNLAKAASGLFKDPLPTQAEKAIQAA